MKNILILGASSDIGLSLLSQLTIDKGYKIGVHCNSGSRRLQNYEKNFQGKVKIFSKNLKRKKNFENLVKNYLDWSKSIDILVQLNGNISSKQNWKSLNEKN